MVHHKVDDWEVGEVLEVVRVVAEQEVAQRWVACYPSGATKTNVAKRTNSLACSQTWCSDGLAWHRQNLTANHWVAIATEEAGDRSEVGSQHSTQENVTAKIVVGYTGWVEKAESPSSWVADSEVFHTAQLGGWDGWEAEMRSDVPDGWYGPHEEVPGQVQQCQSSQSPVPSWPWDRPESSWSARKE